MRFMNRKIWIGTALFMLFTMTLISSACATSRKDAALTFINSCRSPNDQEGYYANPVSAGLQIATLDNTFSAIQIINMLSGQITNSSYSNALAIYSFLDNLKDGTSGGYKDFPGSTTTLQSTYEALQIAEYLNITAMLQRTALNQNENFTMLSYNGNGGFGAYPSLKNNATIFSTYFALKILNFTGNSSLVDKSKVNSFLLSCIKSNNLFSASPNSGNTSIMATAFATMIYDDFLTNYASNVFTGARITAISLYIMNNIGQFGGFVDPTIDNVATLATTYYAVITLNNTGLQTEIPNVNNNLTNWILSHQSNKDGGFIEGDTSETSSSVLATYYAIYALNIFDSSAISQNTVMTLTQIAGSIFVIVLVIVIIALIVIVYYVRKRNKI